MTNPNRNIVKWHYVTDNDDKPTGLRGWDSRMSQRYEMRETEQPGVYDVFSFDGENSSGDWLYSNVATGSLFDCMVAVEAYADDRFNVSENSYEEEDY